MSSELWLISGIADNLIFFSPQKKKAFSRYRGPCSSIEYLITMYLSVRKNIIVSLVWFSVHIQYSIHYAKRNRNNVRTISNYTKSFDLHRGEGWVLQKATPRSYGNNAFVLSWNRRDKVFLAQAAWLELFHPLSQFNSMQSYSCSKRTVSYSRKLFSGCIVLLVNRTGGR